MGLDQWLRKLEPVGDMYKNILNKVLSYDEYSKLKDETSLSFYGIDEIEECFPKEIIDVMTPVKVTERYIDLAKAFQDQFNKDANGFHRGGIVYKTDCTEYWFYDNKTDERYTLILKDDEIKNYEYEKVEDVLAIEMIDSEIAYWRKAYHLQHYMWNTQGYHGDCFYLPLTKEMVEETIDDLKKFRANPNDPELMELFEVSEDDLKDEYLFSDLARTINEFELLLNDDFDNGFICYYEWY